MTTELIEDPPLIRWLFEVGSGTLTSLISTLKWWRSRESQLADSNIWPWLQGMSALGYLDVDWRSNRWRCGATTLTPLPDGDGAFLLAGPRTRPLLRTIANADYVYPDVSRQPDLANLPFPASLFLYGGPDVQPHHLARTLKSECPDIHYSGCAPYALANLLPALRDQMALGAGPRIGQPIDKYTVTGGSTAELGWRSHSGPHSSGLYRWDAPARTYGWFDGDWWRVEREQGFYLAIEAYERRNLRWLPHELSGRLVVGFEGPLPRLHERAVVLASGQLPTRGLTGLIYDGVPRDLAEKICAALQQELEVTT